MAFFRVARPCKIKRSLYIFFVQMHPPLLTTTHQPFSNMIIIIITHSQVLPLILRYLPQLYISFNKLSVVHIIIILIIIIPCLILLLIIDTERNKFSHGKNIIIKLSLWALTLWKKGCCTQKVRRIRDNSFYCWFLHTT